MKETQEIMLPRLKDMIEQPKHPQEKTSKLLSSL